MGLFSTPTSDVNSPGSNSKGSLRNLPRFFVRRARGQQDDTSAHFGGSLKKSADDAQNEQTRLKVYGLDAFQVRAEEEMSQMNMAKVGTLEKYFKAHDPTR